MLFPVVAKIPLILAGCVCDHVALTAPNPPPHPEEREKFDNSKTVTETGAFTVLDAAAVWQVRSARKLLAKY